MALSQVRPHVCVCECLCVCEIHVEHKPQLHSDKTEKVLYT